MYLEMDNHATKQLIYSYILLEYGYKS